MVLKQETVSRCTYMTELQDKGAQYPTLLLSVPTTQAGDSAPQTKVGESCIFCIIEQHPLAANDHGNLLKHKLVDE
jgi:hypothetical protein